MGTTSKVTDRFSVAMAGFPAAHTTEGQKAAHEAARGFWDALHNAGQSISSDLQGRGYLPSNPGVLEAYSVALGHNLRDMNLGESLRQCFDAGTLVHDPVFRVFLKTCGGFPATGPGPAIAAPVAIRAYVAKNGQGSGDKDSDDFLKYLFTTDFKDGGAILKSIKEDDSKNFESNPAVHAHLGELGSPSCFDYPHLDGGGKSCLLEKLKSMKGSRSPPELSEMKEALGTIAKKTLLEPWMMWGSLPQEYRDAVVNDPIFGDAARNFSQANAPDYKSYVQAIAAAGKLAARLADFLREAGCPPTYPWGLLAAVSKLLRDDPDNLSSKVELGYQLLARCCAHGLFFVKPDAAIVGEDPEKDWKKLEKKHPILLNPYIKFPYRWKAVGGAKTGNKRDSSEEPPINVIGHRLDTLLALIRDILNTSQVPSLEDAWETFLDLHAGQASRRYPEKDSEEWATSASGEWPPFTSALIQNKTPPSAKNVNPDQLLTWLFFARPDLRVAVQEARALTLTRVGGGKKRAAREMSPFPQSLYGSYKFSSYRFLVNYLGGQLLHFSQYVTAGGTIDLNTLRADPVAILRLMLEMGYVLSCWFHRTMSLAGRDISKPIEEVGDLVTARASISILQGDFAGMLGVIARKLKLGKVISGLAGPDDIAPPKSENAPYHAWVPWALQKGLRGGGWFPFFYYIFWWQVNELVEPPQEDVVIKIGGRDTTELFREVFKDPGFAPALAQVGSIASILCHFFRSSGVFVDPSTPDYLPPGADLVMVVDVAVRQGRARVDAKQAVIGGKGRNRDVMPRDVMEALTHVALAAGNSYPYEKGGGTRWYPTGYNVIEDPKRAENRIMVRVPGGKKVKKEERAQSNDYMNMDRHVWAAVMGRLNEKGAGFQINMGDAMRQRFLASRAMAEGTPVDPKANRQAQAFRRARKMSVLRDRGDKAAGQSWEKGQELQENFKILCEQFNQNENFPEFASWVFSKSLRGSPRLSLGSKGSTADRSLSADEQELVGNQLRNRFDILGTPSDVIGVKVNRRGLLGRLDQIKAKLLGLYCRKGDKATDFGRFVKDKLEHFRKAGLLPFLDPRLYVREEAVSGAGEKEGNSGNQNVEEEKAGDQEMPKEEPPAYRGWIKDRLRSFGFLYEWEISFASALLSDLLDKRAPEEMKDFFKITREGKRARGGAPAGGSGALSTPREIADLFKEFEEKYPPISRVAPPFSPEDEEGEEGGEEEEEEEEEEGTGGEETPAQGENPPHEVIPCLEDLVLAVLRALALHHERLSLETAGTTGKNPSGNAIRVRLLRVAYAQGYLNDLMRNPELRERMAFRAFLGEGHLSYRGMAAALAIFALPPHKAFKKRFAGTLSDVFKDYANALAVVPSDVLEAEDAFTSSLWTGNILKLSSPIIADFYIAGHWLYEVIGTIAAFAMAGGDLGRVRAKLQEFIENVGTAWGRRVEILMGADWTNAGSAKKVAEDIAAIRDPFADLDLGVRLSPPVKKVANYSPLPIPLQFGKGAFMSFITPDGKLVGNFNDIIAGVASGQSSILYKVTCPPLRPDDELVTGRKYLPEVQTETDRTNKNFPIHDLITREHTQRENYEKDWESRHGRCIDDIDFAEDTAEWLLSVERDGKDWFTMLSFIDARRDAIWAGVNGLLHQTGPCSDAASEEEETNPEGKKKPEEKSPTGEQEGQALAKSLDDVLKEINAAIQAVWAAYPQLGKIAKDVLLNTPFSATLYGALTSDEGDILSGFYNSFIKDRLTNKKEKRDALVEAWGTGVSTGFFDLMDEVLDLIPVDAFHDFEYWRDRVLDRATRRGIITGSHPPTDPLDAYIKAHLELLNLGDHVKRALPGLFHVSLFHGAVESLRNWVIGKDFSDIGDAANYFYVLKQQVDKGVPYDEKPQYWDGDAAAIISGIAGFKDFLDNQAKAAAPLAPAGTAPLPRVLKDVFTVAAARDLRGAIGQWITHLGRETRDNYRTLNYYRARQHEGDLRSDKESRRASEVSSTIKYVSGEFSRAS